MKAIPILMYHNIELAPATAQMRSMYVHPQSFAKQMRYLTLLGYRGLSMPQLLPYLCGEKVGKVVGITFDDGYCDTLNTALPILQRYGFSATCYLVAERLGQYNQWDCEELNVKKPLMNETQVRAWIAAGMDIGAHTLTHPQLTQCATQQSQIEIRQSKLDLENLFNVPVNHFCYPYGDYNEIIRAQVISSGFETAVTTRRGRVDNTEVDLLQLPRVFIARSTWFYLFLLKLHSHYEDRRKRPILDCA